MKDFAREHQVSVRNLKDGERDEDECEDNERMRDSTLLVCTLFVLNLLELAMLFKVRLTTAHGCVLPSSCSILWIQQHSHPALQHYRHLDSASS